MDPIISKLNQQALDKVSKATRPMQPQVEPSAFQQKFDASLTERMMEKIQGDSGLSAQNDMTVLSAENIHVTTEGAEAGQQIAAPGEKYFDLFKDMNKDLISLDAAIEVLTTPGVKFSPRQLLAFQAGIANTTLMAEGFSRFTSAISTGIQTVLQTPV